MRDRLGFQRFLRNIGCGGPERTALYTVLPQLFPPSMMFASISVSVIALARNDRLRRVPVKPELTGSRRQISSIVRPRGWSASSFRIAARSRHASRGALSEVSMASSDGRAACGDPYLVRTAALSAA